MLQILLIRLIWKLLQCPNAIEDHFVIIGLGKSHLDTALGIPSQVSVKLEMF